MSWTYIPSMDEYDKEVTKDTSSSNRYTFNRYMYFKPDQYEQWSKGQNYSGVPYSAELVGNPNIPSAYTHLTGSLSAFYVRDVVSITNLSQEQHGDACSYAMVTIEYQNAVKSGGGGGASEVIQNKPRNVKPWLQPVSDFTVTNQQITVPLTEAYNIAGAMQTKDPICTTAGQPLYGFTTSKWIQRLTWTYCTINPPASENYSISQPVLNNSPHTIFGFQVPYYWGLLLPPTYRRKYYYASDDDTTGTIFYEWSFQIIVNTATGFYIDVINAGTRAKFTKGGTTNISDICTWYFVNPQSTAPPVKRYGEFKDMINAKVLVDIINKGIVDPDKKYQWYGDFVQTPVPLDANGQIDVNALNNPSQALVHNFVAYKYGTWNLGIR